MSVCEHREPGTSHGPCLVNTVHSVHSEHNFPSLPNHSLSCRDDGLSRMRGQRPGDIIPCHRGSSLLITDDHDVTLITHDTRQCRHHPVIASAQYAHSATRHQILDPLISHPSELSNSKLKSRSKVKARCSNGFS